MAVIGLLLALACAAFVGDVVAENTVTVHGHAIQQSLGGMSLGAVFVAGAVVGLIFALGLSMFFGGMARMRTRRTERRALVREQEARTAALAAENNRLEQELAVTRGGTAGPAYPGEPARAPAGADMELDEPAAHRGLFRR